MTVTEFLLNLLYGVGCAFLYIVIAATVLSIRDALYRGKK